MKRQHRLTKKERKEKFRTVLGWLAAKEKRKREELARELNEDLER